MCVVLLGDVVNLVVLEIVVEGAVVVGFVVVCTGLGDFVTIMYRGGLVPLVNLISGGILLWVVVRVGTAVVELSFYEIGNKNIYKYSTLQLSSTVIAFKMGDLVFK